jgi:hypothetical protein
LSGIIKVYKMENPFEMVPRVTIQDQRLSLQAMGLLINICSYPEDWKLYKTELYKRFEKNKRSSVQSAWNELLEAGYVMEKRKRNGKKWDYEYAVRLIPFTDQEKKDFLGCWFSAVENEQSILSSPKPTRIKKDIELNTHEHKTHKDKKHHHPIIEGFNQVQSDLLHEVLQEEKIDDDLKGKLLNRLKGKNFKHKSYIIKALETAKNEIAFNPVKQVRNVEVPEWLKPGYVSTGNGVLSEEEGAAFLEELNSKRSW